MAAWSLWCPKLQVGCLLFASGLEVVNAALAAWWLGWGQCCSELALAAGGSARVFRSCGFTERTAWLHRWQIIERVEKSKECSPAHDSLLKNAHHALSLPAKAPEENVCSLHICHSCWATTIHRAYALCVTHFLHQPPLRLSPQPHKCGYGLSS